MLPRTKTEATQDFTEKVELARGFFGVVFKCLYTGSSEQILKLTSITPEQRYLILKEAKPPAQKTQSDEANIQNIEIQQFMESVATKSEAELLAILSELCDHIRILNTQRHELLLNANEAMELNDLIDAYYKSGTMSESLIGIVKIKTGIDANTNSADAQREAYRMKLVCEIFIKEAKDELARFDKKIETATNKFTIINEKIQAHRTYQNEVEIVSHIQQVQDGMQSLFAKGAVIMLEDGSLIIASELVYHTMDDAGFHTTNLENYLKMFREAYIQKGDINNKQQALKNVKSAGLEYALIEILQQFGAGIHRAQRQLHELKLLHLDTHGGNFMIGAPEILADGKLNLPLKIIDFGLSKKMTEAGEIRFDVPSDNTRELIPERYDRSAKFTSTDDATGKLYYVRSIHTDLYTKKIALMEMLLTLAGETFDKLLAESTRHTYNSSFRKNLTDEEALQIYMHNLMHYLNALPKEHPFKNVLTIYALQMTPYLTAMPNRTAALSTIIEEDNQFFNQAMTNTELQLIEYRQSLAEIPENAVLLELLMPRVEQQQKTPTDMASTSTESNKNSTQDAMTKSETSKATRYYNYVKDYTLAPDSYVADYSISPQFDSKPTTTPLMRTTPTISRSGTALPPTLYHSTYAKLLKKIESLIAKIKDPNNHNKKSIELLTEKMTNLVEKTQPLKTLHQQQFEQLHEKLRIAASEIKTVQQALESKERRSEPKGDVPAEKKPYR